MLCDTLTYSRLTNRAENYRTWTLGSFTLLLIRVITIEIYKLSIKIQLFSESTYPCRRQHYTFTTTGLIFVFQCNEESVTFLHIHFLQYFLLVSRRFLCRLLCRLCVYLFLFVVAVGVPSTYVCFKTGDRARSRYN